MPARPAYAPRSRPHLCFVAPHAWPVFSGDPNIAEVGGAEVQQSILARLFAAEGYRVSMICLDYGQPQHARVDGVTVHKAYRPDAGVPVLRFLHPRLSSIWRAMREVDADVYYCRSASLWAGVIAAFCRRRGKRSIYAGASNLDFAPGAGGQIRYARDRWLYRRGIAAVDAIVAQNEVQQADCRATYGRDAEIVPSCYQLPARVAGARADADRVLWVATMRKDKRPELLLGLAARLPQRRFVMVGGPGQGEAPLYERVRREAATLANVEFTGFLPLAQVERRFETARVLVNTSLHEGLPNTFLQAWARGVPTVASVDVATSAHRRFADLDAAGREIEALFDDQALRERASRHCREHFERSHSPREAFERYARLLDRIAA